MMRALPHLPLALALLVGAAPPLAADCEDFTRPVGEAEDSFLGNVSVQATSVEFGIADDGSPEITVSYRLEADPDFEVGEDGAVSGDAEEPVPVMGRVQLDMAAVRVSRGRIARAQGCHTFGPVNVEQGARTYQERWRLRGDLLPDGAELPPEATYTLEVEAFAAPDGAPVADLDPSDNDDELRKEYRADLQLRTEGAQGSQQQETSLTVEVHNTGLRPATDLRQVWVSGAERLEADAEPLGPDARRSFSHTFESAHTEARFALEDTRYEYRLASLNACVEPGSTPIEALDFDEGDTTIPGGTSGGEGDAEPAGSDPCIRDDDRPAEGIEVGTPSRLMRAYLADEDQGVYYIATTLVNRGNQPMSGPARVNWHPDEFVAHDQDDVALSSLRDEIQALEPGKAEEILASVSLGDEPEETRARTGTGRLSVEVPGDVDTSNNVGVEWQVNFLAPLPANSPTPFFYVLVTGLEFVDPPEAGEPGEALVETLLENLGTPAREVTWTVRAADEDELPRLVGEGEDDVIQEGPMERGDAPAEHSFRFELGPDAWAATETEPQVYRLIYTVEGKSVTVGEDGEESVSSSSFTSQVVLDVPFYRVLPKPDLSLAIVEAGAGEDAENLTEVNVPVPGVFEVAARVTNVGAVALPAGARLRLYSKFTQQPEQMAPEPTVLEEPLETSQSIDIPLRRLVTCAHFDGPFENNGTELEVAVGLDGDLDESDYDNQKLVLGIFAGEGDARSATACQPPPQDEAPPPADQTATDDGGSGGDGGAGGGNPDPTGPTCQVTPQGEVHILTWFSDANSYGRGSVTIPSYDARTCQTCSGEYQLRQRTASGGEACVSESEFWQEWACKSPSIGTFNQYSTIQSRPIDVPKYPLSACEWGCPDRRYDADGSVCIDPTGLGF